MHHVISHVMATMEIHIISFFRATYVILQPGPLIPFGRGQDVALSHVPACLKFMVVAPSPGAGAKPPATSI